MRLLPFATEGFRRLSLALAVATFLVVAGAWARGEMRLLQAAQQACDTLRDEQLDTCLRQGGPAVHDCIAAATNLVCLTHDDIFPRTPVAWKRLGYYMLGGLAGAWFMALAVRVMGWVTEGFKTRGVADRK
jgi:hypothetical protein